MEHEICGSNGAVTLRPLREDDIEYTRILRNQYRECFLFSGEISESAQKKWYMSYLKKNGDYMFTVYLGERRIGAVAIYEVDESTGIGEFGRLMIERQDPPMKGLGVQVTRAACKLGFEELGLARIRLEVFGDNLAARKTYERAGFRYTGRTREEGGRQMVEMELLEKDFA